MALLPTQEDATLAFAEVSTAVKYLYDEKGGEAALNLLLDKLRAGEDDATAVSEVAGESFAAFQSDWKTFLRKQPMPREVLPLTSERLRFKDAAKRHGSSATPTAEGEPGEIVDEQAQRSAHLGALLRERHRTAAAVFEFAKAEDRIGARSPVLSNSYAEALLESGQTQKAETLLKASLKPFPDIAETHLRLGELYLSQKRWAEARAELLKANAVDPFDPEIHVGLAKADHELGDQAAYQVETHAVSLLLPSP